MHTPELFSDRLGGSLPRQAVPESAKTEEWHHRCIDAVAGMAMLQSNRRSREELMENYDLMNSIFREEQYRKIVNPFGLEGDFFKGDPATMQSYNQLASKVRRLAGEEIKRPFVFQVASVAGEAVSEKSRNRSRALAQALEEFILSTAGEDADDADLEARIGAARARADVSWQDHTEIKCNRLLEFLRKRLELDHRFHKGFFDGQVSAYSIYRVCQIAGQPHLRVVNPASFAYDMVEESDFIHDGEWACESRWLSVSQIVDEYGADLDAASLRALEEGSTGNSPGWSGFVQSSGTAGGRGHVRVFDAVWKSRRKVSFLVHPDSENGGELIEDSRKLTSEERKAGFVIEERWVNEVYQGTRIGDGIYAAWGPVPNQPVSLHDPLLCRLPYVGCAYNRRNSVPTSLVDMLKPHQYLYNVIFYKLETEISKSIGKVTRFDLAALPRTEGIDMEKWLYYLTRMGVEFYNSAEEGVTPNTVTANVQEKDMGLSASAVTYIRLLDKLEAVMDDVSGISRQRAGDIFASESVSNVGSAVTQSGYVTEDAFFLHDLVKKEVLRQLLEKAKLCYIDGGVIDYLTDDLERVSMSFSAGELSMTDHAVFVTGTSSEMEVRRKLQALAEKQVQSGQGKFSDLLEVYRNGSNAALAMTIRRTEAEQASQAQQMEERRMQVEESASRAAAEKLAWEKEKFYAEMEARYGASPQEQDAAPAENGGAAELRRESAELQKAASRERTERIKADTALKIARENKTKAELSEK